MQDNERILKIELFWEKKSNYQNFLFILLLHKTLIVNKYIY